MSRAQKSGLQRDSTPYSSLSDLRRPNLPNLSALTPKKQFVPPNPIDVFLSYRVAADSDLAERLYYRFLAERLTVFWDVRSLKRGHQWEEGFAQGLLGARVFVPLISKSAIASWANLRTDSKADNFLLEMRIAAYLVRTGHLKRMIPILVGAVEILEGHGEVYKDFFAGGVPRMPEIAVKSVETQATLHITNAGLPAPESSMTVDEIMREVLKFHGIKLEGVKRKALDAVTRAVANATLAERVEAGQVNKKAADVVDKLKRSSRASISEESSSDTESE